MNTGGVMQTFGGDWTEKKLDAVSKYLAAYQIALKKWPFELVYIDAFCGDGSISPKSDDAPLLKEARSFMRGSAYRALSLEKSFHQYHFIDKSRKNMRAIERMVDGEFPELASRVRYYLSDVNDALPRIINNLDKRKHRVVVFADPYGMQLDWSTVEHVGACGIADFWYLVPTGLAVNRLVTNNGQMPGEWADRLDRFLGTDSWRQRWYRPQVRSDLFAERVEIEKIVGIDEIEADFYKALTTTFPKVASSWLTLRHKGRVLFTLMFACSNPSPKANELAVRIANHLLKG